MITHPVDAYAEAITQKISPAGRYHILACARHLRDREREGTPSFPYVFHVEKANRFLRFGERLKHYKGEWAGQFIRWQPHQVFRLGSIFGWVHQDTSLRRFRNAYSELPRKNGKSLEAAVVALYVTFFDDPVEPGAEGYCAATKRDQAKIVFNDSKRLVLSSGLHRRIDVMTVVLNRESTASKLEPLGADEDSTDGLNAHFINLDELHAFKTRGMIDVCETATGARRQPLVFKITTAGDDIVSPCGDEHLYACNILDQVLTDERYFAFIAHADIGDDWTLPETARKANPNYGVSVNPEDLAAKVTKALGISAAANTYKQKHLNLWVNTAAPWLSMDGWHRGQHDDWTAEDLHGLPCWVGLDLASKLDLTAMVLLFRWGDDAWRLLRWVWTPADTLLDRERRDRAPYQQWVNSGFLLTTPGTRVDHSVIRTTLKAVREHFEIQRIGFDPWHAAQLIEQLTNEDGFERDQVVEVPQTYSGMSLGCLDLEAAVLAGHVDAGGCPLMTYSFANAVVQRDGKDNIYPVKKRSRGRIDPLMATCIAANLLARTPVELPADDPDLVTA